MEIIKEVEERGLFNQNENINGVLFENFYSKEDYQPGKYTFNGNPINQGILINFKGIRREEFITFKLAEKEAMPEHFYDQRQKALFLYAKKGKMIHDNFEEKKGLLLWESQMRHQDRPFNTVKISSSKGEASLSIQGTTGFEKDNIAAAPATFGSIKLERKNSQLYKLYISANEIEPNYNDLVIEIFSAITPIEQLIKMI